MHDNTAKTDAGSGKLQETFSGECGRWREGVLVSDKNNVNEKHLSVQSIYMYKT